MSTLAADLAALVGRRHPDLRTAISPAGTEVVVAVPERTTATLAITGGNGRIGFRWADGLRPVVDGTVIDQPTPPAHPIPPCRYATDPTAHNIVTAMLDATIRAFAQNDAGQLQRIGHLQLEQHNQENSGGGGELG